MIIELEKVSGAFSQRVMGGWTRPYYNKGVCIPFIRKKLGSTKGIDKIRVYIRTKNPKKSNFTKVRHNPKNLGVVWNSRFRMLYPEASFWISRNVNAEEFWFKIEPVK